MNSSQKVDFLWNEETYHGTVEKEYENSLLIQVLDPCAELTEKYLDRIVISKSKCLIHDGQKTEES